VNTVIRSPIDGVLVRVERDPADRERMRRVQGAKPIARIGP